MNDRAWERLANADRLLLYGLIDQAESAYADLLTDVPTSSEAAFGLARAALERGDEQLAQARALDAVRLNPRNDDAQRLAQRLTEVLATRRAGDTAHRPPPVRPSEQASFTGNRSMADHRERERKRSGE